MIRILLFGRGSSNGELYYPFVPKSTENYLNCISAPICDYEGTSLYVCCVLFVVMFECVYGYGRLCLFGTYMDRDRGTPVMRL